MPLASLASEDGLVVALHVMAKGTEIGSLAGLVVGLASGAFAGLASAVGWTRTPRRNATLRLLKFCEWGVALGTLLGAATLVWKATTDSTMTPEGVEERAFRLKSDVKPLKSQLDTRFLIGGALGSAVAIAAPAGVLKDDREPRATLTDKLVRGFCAGGAVGFALGGGATMIYKAVNKKLGPM